MPRSTNDEKLNEQYGFLKRSVDGFTQGHRSEALRIATTIRVLIHETAKSTPLLKLLTPRYLDLEILDIRPSYDPAKTIFYIGIGVRVNNATGLSPILDLKEPNSPAVPVPLGEWWNRTKLIFTDANQKIVFTRKDLILTLANKEGGAHVDTNLPPEFEKYVLESPLKFMVNNILTDTVNLASYAAVEAGVQMIHCLESNFPQAVK